MRKCVLLFFTLVAMQVSAGPAWRWVDAEGTVHYSDRPMPGAVEVYLPDSNTSAPRPQSNSTPAVPATPSVPSGESAQYSQLAISSPTAGETLWNIEGVLDVDVTVAPRLAQGHRLALIVDGAQLPLQPSGTSFTVNEIYRGLHTVQAVIFDSAGNPVLRSAPVQFMVQQPSLLNPNRRN
jgi:hypothetical protein